jgi:uncharacterized membrane protein YdbT with pleckstrin-like domain
MELSEGETILFEGHPSWRAALLFFTRGFGIALVIGVIVWFAWSHALAIVIVIVGFAVTILASVLVRSAIDYAITDERLHIKRGLLSRRIQETRLGRVQNVNVSQNPWERLLRIGDANFDTAADEKSDFCFAGIADPDRVREAVDRAHRAAEQRSGNRDSL